MVIQNQSSLLVSISFDKTNQNKFIDIKEPIERRIKTAKPSIYWSYSAITK
jgi:DNA-binding cell septation regulator SpoVG